MTSEMRADMARLWHERGVPDEDIMKLLQIDADELDRLLATPVDQ
ncbi:hypothetical protein BAAM0499_03445 [Bifidobacterium animalis subsp. animalis MCC 0499]|nr:hypothetical protein [Bifidobacterium animalis]KOA60936.1 hypothetical protein BAAM0499_03445 [Bifidobacterium animalis subsp. animalis MCC 0499]